MRPDGGRCALCARLDEHGQLAQATRMRAHHSLQRLFVDAPLAAGAAIAIDRAQSNYLLNVLRMESGAELLLFNGRDGEWLSRLEKTGKREAQLVAVEQTRAQEPASRVMLCFAPIKGARLDFLVEKAVELGAGILQPVVTQHTQNPKPNLERMAAQAREASEQCGALALPEIRAPLKLERLLAEWDAAQPLLWCDEGAAGEDDCLLCETPPDGTIPPPPAPPHKGERRQPTVGGPAEQSTPVLNPEERASMRASPLPLVGRGRGWGYTSLPAAAKGQDTARASGRQTITSDPAILIGPEGGFSAEERAMLSGCAFVRPVSLGPRILRAETAAVVALARFGP